MMIVERFLATSTLGTPSRCVDGLLFIRILCWSIVVVLAPLV
jgi:hypothetical protein